jgi:hypothetical protein
LTTGHRKCRLATQWYRHDTYAAGSNVRAGRDRSSTWPSGSVAPIERACVSAANESVQIRRRNSSVQCFLDAVKHVVSIPRPLLFGWAINTDSLSSGSDSSSSSDRFDFASPKCGGRGGRPIKAPPLHPAVIAVSNGGWSSALLSSSVSSLLSSLLSLDVFRFRPAMPRPRFPTVAILTISDCASRSHIPPAANQPQSRASGFVAGSPAAKFTEPNNPLCPGRRLAWMGWWLPPVGPTVRRASRGFCMCDTKFVHYSPTSSPHNNFSAPPHPSLLPTSRLLANTMGWVAAHCSVDAVNELVIFTVKWEAMRISIVTVVVVVVGLWRCARG